MPQRNQVTLTFRDSEGNHGVLRNYTGLGPDDVFWDTFTADAAAISNAGLQRAFYNRNIPVQTLATSAPYDDAEDKAVLEFSCTDASTLRVEVPGPKTSMFLADKETVDKAQAAVAALISAIINNLVNKAGQAIVNYIRGYRTRAKNKHNIVGVPIT